MDKDAYEIRMKLRQYVLSHDEVDHSVPVKRIPDTESLCLPGNTMTHRPSPAGAFFVRVRT